MEAELVEGIKRQLAVQRIVGHDRNDTGGES